MKDFIDLLQKQAALVGERITTTRFGTIAGYDPAFYAVKVQLQPEGIITGWIPLGSMFVGNGWGLFAAPSLGDMVEVEFQEGDLEAGICCHRFFNDVDRPLSVPSGEFWLVHKSGSSLKFFNDGTVELITDKNLSIQVTADLIAHVSGNLSATVSGQATLQSSQKIVLDSAEVDITGFLKVSGDITDNTGTGNTKTVNNMRTVYDSHVHPGVQSGASNTGTPNPTI